MLIYCKYNSVVCSKTHSFVGREIVVTQLGVACSHVDGGGSCLLGGSGASQVWRAAATARLSHGHWVRECLKLLQ